MPSVWKAPLFHVSCLNQRGLPPPLLGAEQGGPSAGFNQSSDWDDMLFAIQFSSCIIASDILYQKEETGAFPNED